MSELLDVVTVSDFAGWAGKSHFSGARRTFEARTLLFLGAWKELNLHPGRFALHLVSIGEPPQSVVEKAAACGAQLHMAEPLGNADLGPTLNKLRGLEVAPLSERILLIDSDTVFLQPPDLYAQLPDGIWASPEWYCRVSLPVWREVLASFDLSIHTLMYPQFYRLGGVFELEDPSRGHQSLMPPYYSSGAILLSKDCPLRATWYEVMMDIYERYACRIRDPGWVSVAGSDQLGFAIALMKLKELGHPIHELPLQLHAHIIGFWGGVLTVDNTVLMHLPGIFRLRKTALDFDIVDEWLIWRDSLVQRSAPFPKTRQAAEVEVAQLAFRLNLLLKKHVYPYFRQSIWTTARRIVRRELTRPLEHSLRKLRGSIAKPKPGKRASEDRQPTSILGLVLGSVTVVLMTAGASHLIGWQFWFALATGVKSSLLSLSYLEAHRSEHRLARRQSGPTERSDVSRLETLIECLPVVPASSLPLPEPSGDDSAGPDLLREAILQINAVKPSLVVALGCGTGCVLLGHAVQACGARLVCLEQDESAVDLCKALITAHSLSAVVDLVYAPIVATILSNEIWCWYDVDKLEAGQIDILIVNGPPERVQKQSKYPALPLLCNRLNPSCVVLLAQGREADVALRWIERFPNFRLQFRGVEGGVFLLSSKVHGL